MPRKKQASPALPLADRLYKAAVDFAGAQIALSWSGAGPPEERDNLHREAAHSALALTDLIAEVRALDGWITAPTRAPVRTKRKYTKRTTKPETES